MKYNYYQIDRMFPFTTTKCEKCLRGLSQVKIYTTKKYSLETFEWIGGGGFYCFECIEEFEQNDPDWACGLMAWSGDFFEK